MKLTKPVQFRMTVEELAELDAYLEQERIGGGVSKRSAFSRQAVIEKLNQVRQRQVVTNVPRAIARKRA